MTLFPVHRPRLGLRLGTQTLSLVEVESSWRPGWGGTKLRRWKDRPVPSDLIRVSATESNVQDGARLAEELRALRRDLTGHDRAAEPVALSLPDLCARAALFDFDDLPVKASEREALLRWQLRQRFQLPAAPARLVYRTFPRREASGRTSSKLSVLVVTILDSVLGPYELACAEAGLVPVMVGLNSLQLFDLCRPAMHTAWDKDGEQFFVAVNDESFAFIAVRQRCPVLLRLKPWRAEGSAGLPDELAATMQFYTDLFPAPPGGRARPLFLMDATRQPGQAVLSAEAAEALGIQMVPIDRDGLPVIRSAPVRLGEVLPAASLPAVAGLLS